MSRRPNNSSGVRSWEITPESVYWRRRDILQSAVAGVTAIGVSGLSGGVLAADDRSRAPAWLKQQITRRSVQNASPDTPAPYEVATQYNNFYEFGTSKTDPAEHSQDFNPFPWSVEISGAVNKPGILPLDEFLVPYHLEDRVYRLRCVEAWSMVIPWVGFPLAELIRKVQPTGDAKYVVFESLVRPSEMPGQRNPLVGIDWPYREGLRIDEALHPLAILAVGMYGKTLPAQNGAPLRLVVPWKYGFKSIKSIVRIHFQKSIPQTTWSMLAPAEYGFYANVNPAVDHPRWSQKRERRLPNSLFDQNWQPTRLFNGYEEVASLYTGMDLEQFF